MSHGAVTIINATATGRGCSLAIDAEVVATWQWSPTFSLHGAPDEKLARACLQIARRELATDSSATIRVAATFPPARGLKTSSSAAAAMLEAAGIKDNLEPLCVEAAKLAGVTLTGAYDDQVAVVRGGCHLTDNQAGEVLASFESEHRHVAVWIPVEALPKSDVKNVDASTIRMEIEAAEEQLRAGNLAGAMTLNGAAFTKLYQSVGLPVSSEPANVALAAGAAGAGLSGTGPAVAALFESPCNLQPVAGGTWVWHQAVSA